MTFGADAAPKKVAAQEGVENPTEIFEKNIVAYKAENIKLLKKHKGEESPEYKFYTEAITTVPEDWQAWKTQLEISHDQTEENKEAAKEATKTLFTWQEVLLRHLTLATYDIANPGDSYSDIGAGIAQQARIDLGQKMNRAKESEGIVLKQ